MSEQRIKPRTPPARATPQQPATRAGLIDVTEVAELLGVQVRHIRRLVHERRIPYIKWGHLIRFDPTHIDAWIASHSNEPSR